MSAQTFQKIFTMGILLSALQWTIPATANECRLENGYGGTTLELFDSDFRGNDSFGTDYGGTNFQIGYANCSDRYYGTRQVPFTITQLSGSSVQLRLDDPNRYDDCTVFRSRNWQSDRFDCSSYDNGGGNGGDRDRTLERAILETANFARYQSFDQWNYDYSQVTGRPGPVPDQFLSPSNRWQSFDIDTWCGYVSRVGINCDAPMNRRR